MIAMIGCNQSSAIKPSIEITISPTETKTKVAPLSTSGSISTITPNLEPPPIQVPAPAGLIYCSDNRLWATKTDRTSLLLASDCRSVFSPDYQYLLYSRDGDYYILNLSTGNVVYDLGLWDQESDPEMQNAERLYASSWSPDSKKIYFSSGPYSHQQRDIWSFDIQKGIKTNLSNTENRIEGWPRIFGSGEQLIFPSYQIDKSKPYTYGHLTLMYSNGSNYEVYSSESDTGFFRLSPDRNTAAIFGGKVFTSNDGLKQVTPNAINDSPDHEIIFFEPSWSPSGKLISWSVEIDNGQKTSQGIGIHNLRNNTIELLSPFILLEGEGFPDAPVWSPNNEWITMYALNPENNEWGLHLVRIDGSEEHFLGNFDNIIWESDSLRMILNPGSVYRPSSRGVWIASLENMNPVQVNLPKDAVVTDWIDPIIVESWKAIDS